MIDPLICAACGGAGTQVRYSRPLDRLILVTCEDCRDADGHPIEAQTRQEEP